MFENGESCRYKMSMNKSLCAYCYEPKPLTREHLFPASLHRRLLATNGQNHSSFWLARLNRTIPNEPTIRDVCADCNNGILSDLDAYICKLFDSTLVQIPLRHERITFQYDYHLLKRWLLKACYNSARIHGSLDLFALEAMVPYILGKDDKLGRSSQVFLQLSFPEEIPEQDISAELLSEGPIILNPDINRIGHMYFRASGIGKKLLRAVHLRSFIFYLAFYEKAGGRSEQDFFARIFTSIMSGTTLLKPNMPEIVVECDGVGAWTAFKTSQNSKLVSGDTRN